MNGSQLQPNYRFHSTLTSSKMTPLFELRPWFDEGNEGLGADLGRPDRTESPDKHGEEVLGKSQRPPLGLSPLSIRITYRALLISDPKRAYSTVRLCPLQSVLRPIGVWPTTTFLRRD